LYEKLKILSENSTIEDEKILIVELMFFLEESKKEFIQEDISNAAIFLSFFIGREKNY
jgi:hypothetical protein